MSKYREKHWPEDTYLEKGWYPNMWDCIVDGIHLKGYDCLMSAIAFVNSKLTIGAIGGI